jgi:hypothetical protein
MLGRAKLNRELSVTPGGIEAGVRPEMGRYDNGDGWSYAGAKTRDIGEVLEGIQYRMCNPPGINQYGKPQILAMTG